MHANIIGTNENLFFLPDNQPQLPQWEEPVLQARARYQQTIKDLADQYPTENLLCVTHGKKIEFLSIYNCKRNMSV